MNLIKNKIIDRPKKTCMPQPKFHAKYPNNQIARKHIASIYMTFYLSEYTHKKNRATKFKTTNPMKV